MIHLTRSIKVEFVKPISRTWNEMAPILHTQRNIMGRLLQAGVDAIVACDVAGTEAVKRAIAPEAKAERPSGLAYQAIRRELERIREGRWGDAERAGLDIAASILASASSRAFSDYRNWRAAQYKPRANGHGKKSRANYGRMQPIAVPAVDWELARDGRGFVLRVKLMSEGSEKIALARSRGWHFEKLGAIAARAIDHGDCKITFDERRRKWYAHLSYCEPVVPRPGLSRDCVLVVHRGIRNALTLLSSSGGQPIYVSGAQYMAQRRKLMARRRDRRNSELLRLDDKVARVTTTQCQQWAARVREVVLDRGAGRVVLEDYGGIEPDDDPRIRRALERGPLFQIKQAIVNALEPLGIEIEEVPSEYVSQTCPACGTQDARSHLVRFNLFRCFLCGFERPSDFVAALHMLRRAGSSAHWDRELARWLEVNRKKDDDDGDDS